MTSRYFLFFGLPLALASSLNAGIWTGGATLDDFNTRGNWDNSKAPLINNNSTANNGHSAEFTSDAEPTVGGEISTFLLSVGNNAAVTLATGSNSLTLGNNTSPAINIASGSSLAFSGKIVGGTSDFTDLNFNIDGAASFSGTIMNSGYSIDLTGSGETTLTNTTVASSLSVGNGSTLKGTGTVQENFSMAGGTLSPGTTGAGTMNVTGNVSGSGTWVFDAVDASNRDLLNVTGNLDVSGFTLNLSGTPSIASGPIVIGTYGGNLTGQFSSVSGLGPGQSISYSGGQIAITAAIIPEVTNIIPLSLAFLPLVTMRNRRSRGKTSNQRIAAAC